MTTTSLFFDLDGTLTDPKAGITGCVQYALERLGAPVPSKDELEWCIGPPLRENFVKLAGEDLAGRAVELYRERFSDVGLFENEVYDGIPLVLEARPQTLPEIARTARHTPICSRSKRSRSTASRCSHHCLCAPPVATAAFHAFDAASARLGALNSGEVHGNIS